MINHSCRVELWQPQKNNLFQNRPVLVIKDTAAALTELFK
jgi:hypothetical protein